MSAVGVPGALALGAVLVAVGAAALLWPERIQRWVLGFYDDARGLARWNPLLGWMRTPAYVWSLRIIGVLAIAAGCAIAAAVARGGA
ncbi:MAG TPA: hypothetical protein VEC18_12075 [Myxococcota bacterium]|nr:hypothetical protein [Myxococcota bacterium]